MIRAVLLSVCLLLAARVARADYITICPDLYNTCYGSLTHGFVEVYVLHRFTVGATGSRFTVDISDAPGTSLLGFASDYATSGQVTGEVSVAYDACLSGSIQVGKLFMVTECGEILIAPATAIDCSGTPHDAYTRQLAICVCIATSRCYPAPVESSTWGGVKALYR